MTISRKFDDCYKLLLVGDSGVGKSALTCRYVDQLFHTSFVPTIGNLKHFGFAMWNQRIS